jgi:hypothetical protein
MKVKGNKNEVKLKGMRINQSEEKENQVKLKGMRISESETK